MSSNRESFDDLVTLAQSGDYSNTDPSRIRALYARAKPPGQEPPQGAAAISRVVHAYTSGQVDRLLRLASAPETAALVRPLIGAPGLTWPFDDPTGISDHEALAWLPVVAHASVVSPAIRRFVHVLGCTVRRETWRPASRALAQLALRDEVTRADLTVVARSSFPEGLAVVSQFEAGTDGGLSALPEEYRATARPHRRRHTFVNLCDAVAAGVPDLPFGLPDLLGVPAASMNDTDLSAVLLGWFELLGTLDEERCSRVATAVVSLVGAAPQGVSVQSERGLRDIAQCLIDRFPERGWGDAVLAFLCAPRWLSRKGAARIDGLWTWLETACWCRERGSEVRLMAMRAAAEANGVKTALRLVVDKTLPAGARDGIEAALARLAIVADPVPWLTTSRSCQAVAVVELMALLDDPDVEPVPWDALVQRSTGQSRSPHAASHVPPGHRVELALLVAARGVEPTVLLRDLALDDTALLRLAGSDNGFIARQVAVQTERLLRERSPEEQLRLLWKILQQNPPTKMLTRLESALRGADTPLHELVRALTELDEARGDEKNALWSTTDIARMYRAVAEAARRLDITRSETSASENLVAVAHAFTEVANKLEDRDKGDEAVTEKPSSGVRWFWMSLVTFFSDEAVTEKPSSGVLLPLDAVRNLLGTDEKPGLIQWLSWVEDEPQLDGKPSKADPRTKERKEAWRSLEEAWKPVFETQMNVSIGQCDQVDGALERLNTDFADGSWPEKEVLQRFAKGVQSLSNSLRVRASRRARDDARVERLINMDDEQELVDLLGEERDGAEGVRAPDWLSIPTNKKTHQYLLDCLNFGAARRLRKKVVTQVSLPGGWRTVMPLIVGAGAGIWLVLDVATEWKSVTVEQPLPFWGTLVLCYLGSLGLVGTLLMQGSWGSDWKQRVTRSGRVIRVHTYVVVAAAFFTWVMMSFLGNTHLVNRQHWYSQWSLWSALALFLGIFLGLILQGASARVPGMTSAPYGPEGHHP